MRKREREKERERNLEKKCLFFQRKNSRIFVQPDRISMGLGGKTSLKGGAEHVGLVMVLGEELLDLHEGGARGGDDRVHVGVALEAAVQLRVDLAALDQLPSKLVLAGDDVPRLFLEQILGGRRQLVYIPSCRHSLGPSPLKKLSAPNKKSWSKICPVLLVLRKIGRKRRGGGCCTGGEW